VISGKYATLEQIDTRPKSWWCFALMGEQSNPPERKKKIIRRRRFLASRKRVPSTGNIPDPRGGNQRT
jgi:hypothetical protein